MNLKVALGILLFSILGGGCHHDPTPSPTLPLYPVTGELRMDGRPAVGATLKFLPMQPVSGRGGRTPAATVGDDGRFKASYFGVEDGAPAGTYKVLIFWLAYPPEGGLPMDRLQGKYCDENNPAAIVNVLPQENVMST